MKTLPDLLDQVTRTYSARPALLYAGEEPTWSWTYATLDEQTGRLAAWLAAQGVGPGARVILWAPNSPWWVAAYFATLRLGAIAVPLDVRSTPDFVARVIDQTTPVIGLLGAATRAGWPPGVPSALLESCADLPASAAPPRPAGLDPASTAVIAFTSGTTGIPKGVILTHGNILADATAVNPLVPRYPAYRLLSVLPLSHMLEQVIGLLVPLLRGASITYTASRQSTVLMKAIQEQQITTILLVPEAVELLMNAIEQQVQAQGQQALWHRMQQVAALLPAPARRLLFRPVHQRLGGHLNFLMCGGARLAPELIHKWDLLGVPVLQGYGTTEAAPVITIEPPHDRNPEAVGKPIGGVQVRLAEDHEILIKGPNVTPGYWANPQATAAAFVDGWFKTGDLGEFDERGFLHIQGRKQDRIVLASGQKVYPDDVEQVLKSIPGVADATVLGMPSPHGPVVHAVLIPQTPAVDVPAAVRQANALLGSHQQIRGYTTWPEPDFPRTALRKVKKHEVLAALHDLQTVAAPAPAARVATAAGARSLAHIAALAQVDPAVLTPDATLGEAAGLDSLAQIELLAAIERDLGVHVDEADIGPTTTVGELLDLVEHRPAPPSTVDAKPTTPAPPPGGSPPRAIDPGKARWYHHAVRVFVRGVFGIFLRVRIVGRRNLPRGPAILCVNHLGWADLFVPLLYLPLEPRLHVLGEEHVKYRSGFRNWLIDRLDIMVPLDRSKPLAAFEAMVQLLRAGGSLLLYPEGVVGHSEGTLQPLQEGAALAALEAGVPLVPAGITGAASLWFGKRLTLRIGRPLDPAAFAGDPETRRAAMTRQLAARMRGLLPGEAETPRRKPLGHWLTHLF